LKVNLNKYEYIIKLKDRVYKKVRDEVIKQAEENIKSLINTTN